MKEVFIKLDLEEYAEMLELIAKESEEDHSEAEPKRELKDQRLTLAIRKSAMIDLKNLVSLKQTTLNDYVNQLIEADVERNRKVLDEFNKFVEIQSKK